MDNETNAVLIERIECLNCARLLALTNPPDTLISYDCHDSPNCPANHYVITLGCDMDKMADAIATATHDNNVTDLSRQMQELCNYHTAVQRKVLELSKL